MNLDLINRNQDSNKDSSSNNNQIDVSSIHGNDHDERFDIEMGDNSPSRPSRPSRLSRSNSRIRSTNINTNADMYVSDQQENDLRTLYINNLDPTTTNNDIRYFFGST